MLLNSATIDLSLTQQGSACSFKYHKITSFCHMIQTRLDFSGLIFFCLCESNLRTVCRCFVLSTLLKAESELLTCHLPLWSLPNSGFYSADHAKFCAWPTPTGGCPPTGHKKESVCGSFSVYFLLF